MHDCTQGLWEHLCPAAHITRGTPKSGNQRRDQFFRKCQAGHAGNRRCSGRVHGRLLGTSPRKGSRKHARIGMENGLARLLLRRSCPWPNGRYLERTRTSHARRPVGTASGTGLASPQSCNLEKPKKPENGAKVIIAFNLCPRLHTP